VRAVAIAMVTRYNAIAVPNLLHSMNCKRFTLAYPELCPCTLEFPLGEEDADDIPSDHLTFELHR
jgi:hypothetical protein